MQLVSTRTLRRRVLSISACCLAGILTLAAPAFGATVTASGPITLTAGSGDTDTVSVSKNAFGYVLTDSAGATAGTGCSQTSSTEVLCASSVTGQITLNLGNQLDYVSIDDTLPDYLRVTVNGDGDGTTVYAPDAENPILVNSTAGDVRTGVASDTLNVGSATYTGLVDSGDGDDHVNISTNMPNGQDYENGGCYYGQVETCDPIDMYGGEGDDHIVMSSTSTGVMYYNGEGGDDVVFGGAAGDQYALQEGDGDDWYFGGGGNDRFLAYTGSGNTHDHLFGEAGNDWISVFDEDGHVMFDGGPGTDSVHPHFNSGSPPTAIEISLDGVMNDGGSSVFHNNFMGNVENVKSGGLSSASKNDGADVLSGNAEVNLLEGWGGNDDLTGYAGADTLKGGAGNDVLRAEDGEADTLEGGAGDDVIYADDGAADTIDCGTESDTVYADSYDTVNGNCETVI